MGAGAAAAAAAEARRREEEEMSGYTDQDLSQGWEFKFLRSGTAAFRKPDVLRAVLQEESRAGWVLLEKFDDGRLRFKRPVSAREKDALLPADVDPYRTRYGMHDGVIASLIIGGIFAVILALIGVLSLLRAGH